MIKLKSFDELAANIGVLQTNLFIHKRKLEFIDRLLDSLRDEDLIRETVYEVLKRDVVDAVEYFDKYEDIINNSMIKQLSYVIYEVYGNEISNW